MLRDGFNDMMEERWFDDMMKEKRCSMEENEMALMEVLMAAIRLDSAMEVLDQICYGLMEI